MVSLSSCVGLGPKTLGLPTGSLRVCPCSSLGEGVATGDGDIFRGSGPVEAMARIPKDPI